MLPFCIARSRLTMDPAFVCKCITSIQAHSVNLLKILFIRSGNENTRFRELRKSIFRFFFSHKVEWRVRLHKPFFVDQMFKYRGSPPTYAHILLTTPQKHPRLASYQLWSHSERNQARISRTTAKITCFTFCGYLKLRSSPIKIFKEMSRKSKNNMGLFYCRYHKNW